MNAILALMIPMAGVFKIEKTVTNSPMGLLDRQQAVERAAAPPINVGKAYDYLTGSGIVDRSGGALSSLSPAAASGLIGGFMVETGDPTLTETDVIEKNARKGRGISQYTDSRRGPYDRARLAHIEGGGDPNDIGFQLDYMVDEYMGKHDGPSGNSLSGWTKSMQNFGQMDDPRAAASAFTSGRGNQEGYFRPSEPHMDRRMDAASRVFDMMQNRNVTPPAPDFGAAKTIQPAASGNPFNGLIKMFGR